MLKLSHILLAMTPIGLNANHLAVQAQENQSILEISERADAPVKVMLASGSQKLAKTELLATEGEVVRDRFANGKVQSERTVVLDESGNYVSHGDYRQYSDKGDLLVSGNYQLGQRTGLWTRFLTPASSRLLSSYPFNKLRPPFSSTVEFVDDKMNGVWVIADRDKNVACQIELRSGVRHGIMTLYHPNGQVYIQSHYDNGVLDGTYLERLSDGKVATEENYSQGRKQITETQHFNNRQVKSVMRYLTAPQKATALDNWETTELANFSTPTERQLHGEFVTYHDNGQLASKGSYVVGKLEGEFTAWYRTGESSASGQYEKGQQVGQWLWRHPNGMRKATATYVAGKPNGPQQSWDESGKAILR